MVPKISLSTCWLSHRHSDGYAMVQEVVDLGFEYVELSHGIQISLVPGIFKALAENLIRVSSCHNFCPLPPHVTLAAPNLYQPSSPDSRELDLWVRHTKRSIDTTFQVGANWLVTHMGSLFFFWGDPSKKLKWMAKEQVTADVLQENDAFVRAREKLMAKMRKASPPHVARLCKCVEQVREYALQKEVTLCAENREGLLELPLDGETGQFSAMTADLGMVKLWHDTGHAKLKERLGLLDHATYLKEHHQNIVGFHLHDTTPEGRDHQALGEGNIDFNMVKKYFRGDQVFVLELSPKLNVEQVLQSKAFLEELLGSSAVGLD